MTEGGLTPKQRMFVAEYLVDFNATQAAIRAGYSPDSASVQGSRLLSYANVSGAINEAVMSREETLLRITDIARGDLADLFDITSLGFVVDLAKAKADNKTKLLKKVKQKVTTITRQVGKDQPPEEVEIVDTEIELLSQLEALQMLAKFHKLLTEKTDMALTVAADVLVLPGKVPGNT